MWNQASYEETQASEVVRVDETIKDASAVWLLPLTSGVHISDNPRLLDDAFLPTENGSMGRALLLLIMRTAHAYRARVTSKLRGDFPEAADDAYHGSPVNMYYETVTGDPRDASRRVFDTRPIMGDLHSAGDSGTSLARALQEAGVHLRRIDPARRHFMRDIGDTVPNRQLRFWFFFMHPADLVDPSRIFQELIQKAESTYAEHMGLGARSRYAPAASSSDAGLSFGHTLAGVERSRLIRSLGTLAAAADTLHGHVAATLPAVLSKINDPRVSFSDNPVNPRFIFSPKFLLKHCAHTVRQRARDFSRYYDAETKSYSFPLANHVIRLSSEDLVPGRLFERMLPRYQAENVQQTRVVRFQMRGTRVRVERAVGSDDDDSDVDEAEMVARSDALNVADADRAAVYGAAFRELDMAASSVDPTLLGREAHHSASTQALRDAADGKTDTKKSALHRLRVEGAELRYELERSQLLTDEETHEPVLSRKQCRAIYLENQETMARAYIEQCTATDSRMSSSSLAVNRWLHGQRDPEGNFPTMSAYEPLMASTLSVFGDMVARMHAGLESAVYCSTAHSVAADVLWGNLDAARYGRTLHVHNFMYGAFATSKSFIGKLLCNSYILGTVREVGSFTTNAFTCGEDLTKLIMWWDETPMKAMYTAANDRDDETERLMKVLLTEGRFCKTIAHHDSKAVIERQSVTYETDAMCTWNFAWNWPAYKLSPACRSRVVMQRFVTHVRRGRAPEDFANVRASMTARARANAGKFEHNIRRRQAMHWFSEDLLTVFSLTDPTVECFNVMMPRFVATMRDRFCLQVGTRTVQVMNFYVRIFVIQTALTILYSLPKSRYYMKPFEHRQLLALDPLLHDTPEIVAFVFDMFRAQYVDVNEHVLREKLRSLYTATAARMGGGTAMLYTDKTIFSFNDAAQAAPPAASKFAKNGNIRRFGQVPQANNADGGMEALSARHIDRYCSYFDTGARLDQLKENVADMCAGDEIQLKNTDTGEGLRAFTKVSFMGYRYERAGCPERVASGEIDNIEDAGLFGDIRPRRRDGRCVQKLAFEEHGRYFVHIEFLLETRDAVQESISACYTEFDDPSKTRVRARALSNKYPYLLQTYHPERLDSQRIVYRNVAVSANVLAQAAFPRPDEEIDAELPYDAEADGLDETGGVEIAESLDARSRRMRARALYLDEDVDGAEGGVCDLEAIDAWAQMNYVGRETKSYPLGYRAPYVGPDGTMRSDV